MSLEVALSILSAILGAVGVWGKVTFDGFRGDIQRLHARIDRLDTKVDELVLSITRPPR